MASDEDREVICSKNSQSGKRTAMPCKGSINAFLSLISSEQGKIASTSDDNKQEHRPTVCPRDGDAWSKYCNNNNASSTLTSGVSKTSEMKTYIYSVHSLNIIQLLSYVSSTMARTFVKDHRSPSTSLRQRSTRSSAKWLRHLLTLLPLMLMLPSIEAAADDSEYTVITLPFSTSTTLIRLL